MSTLEKPFIPVELQVQKLKARGLIIENEEKAKVQLLRTSYYDLINGYKDMFLIEEVAGEDDKFKEGTKIEDIIELYRLDRKIRHSVLEVLLDIECVFYSSLAYSIASQYGEKHVDYLKKTNYKEGDIQQHNQKCERDNLLGKLKSKINNPTDHPLLYYKEKYDNIPPWILVKDLTFGQLVKLYKLSKAPVKNQVIENITGNAPTEKDKEFFIKCLEQLNKFRNWAAHGGRIYNHKTSTELPYYESYHMLMEIDKKAYKNGNGRVDFAALVIGVIYFFKKDPQSSMEFFFSLRDSLDGYRKRRPLEYEGVLQELGIPHDFYESAMEELLYKNIPVV